MEPQNGVVMIQTAEFAK